MVSHDIKEVVFMADRIIVLSANPGRVRTVVENHLPRPRNYRSNEFLALVDQLHEVITGRELPDLTVVSQSALPTVEPLPETTSSEIVGLLEYLDARGGCEELFRIAADTNRRIWRHHQHGACRGDVGVDRHAEADGGDRHRWAGSSLGRSPTRKGIWREQLLKLRLFREIYDCIQRQPEHAVNQDFVEETIILRLPQENHEKTFQTFIRWARFGNLLAFDEDTGMVSLQEEKVAAVKQ